MYFFFWFHRCWHFVRRCSEVCNYICVFAVCLCICALHTPAHTLTDRHWAESNACAEHSAPCQAEVSVFHFCLPLSRRPCVFIQLPSWLGRLLLIKNGRQGAGSCAGSGSNRSASWTRRMSILISLHNYARSLVRVLPLHSHLRPQKQPWRPHHKVTNSFSFFHRCLPKKTLSSATFYEGLTTFWYKFACLYTCV